MRRATSYDDYDDYSGAGFRPVDDLADDVLYVSDEPGLLRRSGRVIAFMLLVCLVTVSLGGYWLHSQIYPTPSGDELTFDIPADTGIVTISRLLEDEGIVTNGAVFRYYARLKGIGPVRPGTYDRLRRGEPMDEVITRLEAGPVPIRTVDVPVPEGLWVTDVGTRILERFPKMTDTELAAAMTDVRSTHQPEGKPIDGFLFPATYKVAEDADADERALVEQMVRKFDDVADEVGLVPGTAKLAGVAGGHTLAPYDVLKVASYVEAEAKVPEDRPRIARVIYNRLRKDMRLEIDATLFNAIGQHKPRLDRNDKQVDSPYNLYRNKGFTPTPINSPGADSLRAALNPSTEPDADKWLYYVLVDKDGHHSFSQTREEHDRKVAEAQKAGLL